MANTQQTISELVSSYYKGDAHIHSSHVNKITWSKWIKTFNPRIITKTYTELGFEFMALVSHSSHPARPHILSSKSKISTFLLRKRAYVAQQLQHSPCKVLVGVEANILYDTGGHPVIDVPDEILSKLDVVIASRHALRDPHTNKIDTNIEKDPEKIKESLIMAITNPNVHIIGHPDRYTRKDRSRSTSYWDAYWGVWPEILRTMKKHKTAFEINISSPPSLQLVTMALASGVSLFISSDAHRTTDFRFVSLLYSECSDVLVKKTHTETVAQLRKPTKEWAKRRRLSTTTYHKSFQLLSELIYWSQYLHSHGVNSSRVVNSSLHRMNSFLESQRP